MQELEQERVKLLRQWKAQMIVEQDRLRYQNSKSRLYHDIYGACLKPVLDWIFPLLATIEVILSNMPLTIGAVGLGWVAMGVVWFKFYEEMSDTCKHVHYFSEQCTNLEFPG